MKFIIFGSILSILTIQNGCTAQSQTVQQIFTDKLTSEYLGNEKNLWKKIDTQQILIDRGQLFNEIYREHNKTVNNDFGDTKTIWSLGIQKNQRLINTVLAIDTNYKNVRHYLTNAEYVKLVDLAKSATTQMEKSMDDLFEAINEKTFWTDILSDVKLNILFLLF